MGGSPIGAKSTEEAVFVSTGESAGSAGTWAALVESGLVAAQSGNLWSPAVCLWSSRTPQENLASRPLYISI